MSEMVYCFICGTTKSTILSDMTFLLAVLLIRVAKVKCWIIIDDTLYTLYLHIIICVFFGMCFCSDPIDSIPPYYPTALCKEQITPEMNTNVALYLYSRGPVRNFPTRT